MSHLGILLASDHYPQVRASDTIDRQLTQWLASLGHDITRVSTFETWAGDLPETAGAADVYIVSGLPLNWTPCCRDREGALCLFLKGVAATGRPILALNKGEHVLQKALASPFDPAPETSTRVCAIRNPFRSFHGRDRLFAFNGTLRAILELPRPEALTLSSTFPFWRQAA